MPVKIDLPVKAGIIFAIISLIGGLLIFLGYHLNEQKAVQYVQENETRLYTASQSTDSVSCPFQPSHKAGSHHNGCPFFSVSSGFGVSCITDTS